MAQKGDERKKEIIEAASCLFAEKGFKDVTMSDICARTGLSRGGLYRHFSSTSEIFREIITDNYSFMDRIEKKESALDILTETIGYVQGAVLQKEKSLSLAIYEYSNIGDNNLEIMQIEEKAKKRWISLIQYGMETGEFASCDAESVAELILYYYQGLLMWSRVMPMNEQTIQHYRNNILRFLTGAEYDN